MNSDAKSSPDLFRAEETRTKAEEIWNSEEAKQRLLRIAQEYDRLADHAAERLRLDELSKQQSAQLRQPER